MGEAPFPVAGKPWPAIAARRPAESMPRSPRANDFDFNTAGIKNQCFLKIVKGSLCDCQ
jgi:hypothetical protein